MYMCCHCQLYLSLCVGSLQNVTSFMIILYSSFWSGVAELLPTLCLNTWWWWWE